MNKKTHFWILSKHEYGCKSHTVQQYNFLDLSNLFGRLDVIVVSIHKVNQVEQDVHLQESAQSCCHSVKTFDDFVDLSYLCIDVLLKI